MTITRQERDAVVEAIEKGECYLSGDQWHSANGNP